MTRLGQKLCHCLCAVFGAVSMLPSPVLAQSETTAFPRTGSDLPQQQRPMVPQGSTGAQPQINSAQDQRPNRVVVFYNPPTKPQFQELYGLLRERRALEKIQQMLSPFRLPVELTVEMTECGEVNASYGLRNGLPVVVLCYEFLQKISGNLPKATTPVGLTPSDAAIGQLIWATLHEVGHAVFDIFKISIFGHEEDAADNFATYILLHFNKGQARPLIAGAAWAWQGYIREYKRNPVVQKRLAAFTSQHGQPEQRFYNLLCLAYGADPKSFPEVETFLPASRLPNCKFEYAKLDAAFRREIVPHIDMEMAKQVLNTNWLSGEQLSPAAQK